MRAMRVQFNDCPEVFGADNPTPTRTPRRGITGPPTRVMSSGAKRRPLNSTSTKNNKSSNKHKLAVTPPHYGRSSKRSDFQNSAEKGRRKAAPVRKPSWDSTIHDLSKYRASKKEITARKLRYTSRNNFIARADLEKKGISVEEQEDVFNQILTPKKENKSCKSREINISSSVKPKMIISSEKENFAPPVESQQKQLAVTTPKRQTRARTKRAIAIRTIETPNQGVSSENNDTTPEQHEAYQKETSQGLTPVIPATQRKKKSIRLGSPATKSGNGRIRCDQSEDEIRYTDDKSRSSDLLERDERETEELREIYETLQHQVRHFERVAGVSESDREDDSIRTFNQEYDDSVPEPPLSVGGSQACAGVENQEHVSVTSVLHMCSKLTKYLETSENRLKQEEEARAGLEAKVDSLVSLTKSLTLGQHSMMTQNTSSPLSLQAPSPGVPVMEVGGGALDAQVTATSSSMLPQQHPDTTMSDVNSHAFDSALEWNRGHHRTYSASSQPTSMYSAASQPTSMYNTAAAPSKYVLRTPQPVKVSASSAHPLKLTVQPSFAPVQVLAPPTPRSSRSSPALKAAAMAAQRTNSNHNTLQQLQF